MTHWKQEKILRLFARHVLNQSQSSTYTTTQSVGWGKKSLKYKNPELENSISRTLHRVKEEIIRVYRKMRLAKVKELHFVFSYDVSIAFAKDFKTSQNALAVSFRKSR